MSTEIKTRARHAVIGALVADAAAMGLHWIYDQEHILKIAPQAPEFRAPDPAHYKDVRGYFAHPTRLPGDPSQYGEQMLVMLRALQANGGRYDAQVYASGFRSHFGYGGAFVGYIDYATRTTLDNFRRAEETALAQALALPFDGPDSVTQALVVKALALHSQYSGDTLRQKFEEAIRITHDDDAVVQHGFTVLDQIIAAAPASGSDDDQMPAIAKLPPLVAVMAGQDDLQSAATSAVKITNDHPHAALFGEICTAMMESAILTGDPARLAEIATARGTAETKALLSEATARQDETSSAVTRHFGMACYLRHAVPSVLHNVLTAPDYTAAIRRNIYAGGDTCGRAVLLGALAGALHGVGGDKGIPEDWIDRLSHKVELIDALDVVLG